MSAPGGICECCNKPLKWTFAGDEMLVVCPRCPDLFGQDYGTFLACSEGHEKGHETGDEDPVRFYLKDGSSF